MTERLALRLSPTPCFFCVEQVVSDLVRYPCQGAHLLQTCDSPPRIGPQASATALAVPSTNSCRCVVEPLGKPGPVTTAKIMFPKVR